MFHSSGSHNPPHWGLTSSMAQCSVCSSNTICNNLSPLLADIVRFNSLRIVVSLTVFKMRLLGRYSYTLIRRASFSPVWKSLPNRHVLRTLKLSTKLNRMKQIISTSWMVCMVFFPGILNYGWMVEIKGRRNQMNGHKKVLFFFFFAWISLSLSK